MFDEDDDNKNSKINYRPLSGDRSVKNNKNIKGL